jgi:hypothetical protein
LDDIESLINQSKTALTNLSPITGKAGGLSGDWWSWGKWVVIVVGVSVAAILGYMFWPTTKLGEPKPSPTAAIQEAMTEKKDKITETFAKLRDRWKKIKEKEEKPKEEGQ